MTGREPLDRSDAVPPDVAGAARRLESLLSGGLRATPRVREAFTHLEASLDEDRRRRQGGATDALLHDLFCVIDRLDDPGGGVGDLELGPAIRADILTILADHGVDEIGVGEVLDPGIHEVEELRAFDCPAAPMTLVTRRRGFSRGGVVLRPALVAIEEEGPERSV